MHKQIFKKLHIPPIFHDSACIPHEYYIQHIAKQTTSPGVFINSAPTPMAYMSLCQRIEHCFHYFRLPSYHILVFGSKNIKNIVYPDILSRVWIRYEPEETQMLILLERIEPNMPSTDNTSWRPPEYWHKLEIADSLMQTV